MVSQKLADFDVKGAIRILNTNDTLAMVDDNTFKILQSKHPPSITTMTKTENGKITEPRSGSIYATEDMEQQHCESKLVQNTESVQRLLQSFPGGSSGGIDGLLPQHLKDLTAKSVGVAGEEILKALTSLVQHVIHHGIPNVVRPWFFGARLIALSKKGGVGVRPIAVGLTLRRLVSKFANTHVKGSLKSKFLPQQVGYGVQAGVEAAVHSVRAYIGSNRGKRKAVVKIDFENAFNSMLRKHLLEKAEADINEIYLYVEASYGASSFLL